MNISRLRDWLRDPKIRPSEKALYAAVVLTFFCLPLGTAPSTITGGMAAAIWLFSGLALAKRQIYLAIYWWPIYALIALPWIGMLYTRDTFGLGLDYAEKAYYWLFGFCVAAMAFEKLRAGRCVQAFMLGLGINVVAAIVQIVFHLPDENSAHRGLGPDYSTLSAYLIVGIMMGVFYLARRQPIINKIALVGIIGLYFFHLVILQSRASYVAFVILIPFIGYTFFKTHQLTKTVALCVLIPGLMMVSPVVRQRAALTVQQFTYHLHATDGTAWGEHYSAQQDRFYMWNGALKIIAHRPFLGAGTGGYATALRTYGSDPDAPLIAHPHNNFLYMAVSFGVVGLVVFLWFLVASLVNGWRHRKTTAGYMLLSVVLVMTVTGLFNTQILDVGTALLLSLVIGFQQSFNGTANHGT
jgi:O-antigen ligase